MENELEPQSFYNDDYQLKGCSECGDRAIEEGYEAKLCGSCRRKLATPKIPIPIILGSLVIIAILIIAGRKLPEVVDASIAYERGLRAEKSNQYYTAMKNFEKAYQTYPKAANIHEHLFLAYYKNVEMEKAWEIYDFIAGNEVKEEELFEVIDEAYKDIEYNYVPADNYDNEAISNVGPEEGILMIQEYLLQNGQDLYASYDLAYFLYASEAFEQAVSILENDILAYYPNTYAANRLLADIYFTVGAYDEAYEIYSKLLAFNSENMYLLRYLVDLEIERYEDESALNYATQAYNLEPTNPANMYWLAISYHYNEQIEMRDGIIADFEQYSGDELYESYLEVLEEFIAWEESGE